MKQGSDQPPRDAYVYVVRDEAAYLQTDEDAKPEIIAEPQPDPAWFKCWFCRRTDRRVLFGAEYPAQIGLPLSRPANPVPGRGWELEPKGVRY